MTARPPASGSLLDAAITATARAPRAKDKSRANRGKEWEAKIDAVHAGYLARGIGVVKNPPSMKVVRTIEQGPNRPPELVCVYTAKGPPDYSVQAYGLSLTIEAKTVNGDAFPLAKVADHQAERMTRHEINGGRALVLARVDGVIWFLPWSTLGPMWREHHDREGRAAPGTASLDALTLSVIGIELRDADWLPTALAMWRATC